MFWERQLQRHSYRAHYLFSNEIITKRRRKRVLFFFLFVSSKKKLINFCIYWSRLNIFFFWCVQLWLLLIHRNLFSSFMIAAIVLFYLSLSLSFLFSRPIYMMANFFVLIWNLHANTLVKFVPYLHLLRIIHLSINFVPNNYFIQYAGTIWQKSENYFLYQNCWSVCAKIQQPLFVFLSPFIACMHSYMRDRQFIARHDLCCRYIGLKTFSFLL